MKSLSHIQVHSEDTSGEVVARIVKAVSRKYACGMRIDFQDGRRVTQFVGDHSFKSHIAEEVREIFDQKTTVENVLEKS